MLKGESLKPHSRFIVGACACTLLLLAQCARDAQRPMQPDSVRSRQPSGADEIAGAPAGLPDVHEVLEAWSAGDSEQAVKQFLHMWDANAPLDRYRLHHMSEEQFVALPAADRDRQGSELAAELEVLNRFSGHLVSRARAAADSGDMGAAEKILAATQRLGAANMGPSVTRLANTVGEAIHQRAAQELSELARTRR